MWIAKSLKKGILTTNFPREKDEAIPESLYDVGADEFRCLNACMGRCEGREDRIEVKRSVKFKKSVHIFVLDVGSCSACNREISLLKAPQYDMHRFGFFFTPVPAHADILLVIGSPTDKMLPVLREAYDAMPEPRYVMGAGACANGASGNGMKGQIEIDARISGCPPQPMSILKALLMVAGRLKA